MAELGVAIVGPTASGKSALAIEAARRFGNVEIVSVDSMAVYREMDLATAKSSQEIRREIPHHLIDILDPSEECTVSLFQTRARVAISEIRARGHVPLLVGGTGLYHRAVIDDLEIPGQYPEVRIRLDQEAQTLEGRQHLYERLVEEDPVAASRIEPENLRRVLRALEVIEGSGQPFSSFGPGLEQYPTILTSQIGVDVDLAEIDHAVEQRVHGWMDQGLVEEIRSLARRPKGLSRTAGQAIGYREFLDWLDEGGDEEHSSDAPLEATIARTKSLVRRQRSWFRRDPRVQWAANAQHASELLAMAIEHVTASNE